MKTVNVDTEHSIQFTPNAERICLALNYYKRLVPSSTFKEMAKVFGLSHTNVRRYYYGMHHYNGNGSNKNWGVCYNQVREGACVPI